MIFTWAPKTSSPQQSRQTLSTTKHFHWGVTQELGDLSNSQLPRELKRIASSNSQHPRELVDRILQLLTPNSRSARRIPTPNFRRFRRLHCNSQLPTSESPPQNRAPRRSNEPTSTAVLTWGSRTGRPGQENRLESLPDFHTSKVHQMTHQNASLIELSSNPMSFGV